VKSLGFDPSEELDTALRDLYALCVDLDTLGKLQETLTLSFADERKA